MKVVPICLHCGKESPSAMAFCCRGCEAAYSLIQGAKLGEFYRLEHRNIPINESHIDDSILDPMALAKYAKRLHDSKFQISFVVENITCSACSWLLEKVPLIEPQIHAVQVSPASKTLIVQFSPKIKLGEVAGVFYSLGYPVHLKSKTSLAHTQTREMRSLYLQTAVACASMIATMHIGLSLLAGVIDGMELPLVKGLGVTSMVLSLPSLFYSAKSFYRNAWLALQIKKPNLDLLVTIAVAAGFLASCQNILLGINQFYFDAITMLVALLLGGRLVVREMENRFQVGRIDSLNEVLSDSSLKPGESVTVKSGAPFPCDGTVLNGQSHMDASWLTGESMPITIEKGSEVYAGALNRGREIIIQTTNVGLQTRAGKILQLLEKVEKGSLGRFSEKAEQTLVSIALLGFAILLVSTLASPQPHWNTLIALVLVICPCALGLAVPTATAVALSQAFERGILVKGASALEKLSDITSIVFDKTGTLTSSDFGLLEEKWNQAFLAEKGFTDQQAIDVAYSMAVKSNHVLAQNLSLHLRQKAKPIIDLVSNEVFGRGIVSNWRGHQFKIGSAAFTGAESLQLSHLGIGSLFFTFDDQVIAQFDVKTQIDPRTPPILKDLSKDKAIYLLSGDEEKPVAALAHAVGIAPSHTHFQKSPEEKLEFIEALAKKEKVMMVGDGINDTLAFAKSHVSVGVQSTAQVALERCDIFLSNTTIASLPLLFRASKKLRRVVLFNITWSVVFNILGVAAVLNGVIGPIACAVLMPASSLTVLLISSLARYFPSRENPL